LSGFTTFISHGGNPPIAYYLLPRGLPKTIFAGIMIAFFLVINVVKLALYLWLSTNNTRVLRTAVALVPAVPLGVWAGKSPFGRAAIVFLVPPLGRRRGPQAVLR